MRNNQPVTQREYVLDEETVLIKVDPIVKTENVPI